MVEGVDKAATKTSEAGDRFGDKVNQTFDKAAEAKQAGKEALGTKAAESLTTLWRLGRSTVKGLVSIKKSGGEAINNGADKATAIGDGIGTLVNAVSETGPTLKRAAIKAGRAAQTRKNELVNSARQAANAGLSKLDSLAAAKAPEGAQGYLPNLKPRSGASLEAASAQSVIESDSVIEETPDKEPASLNEGSPAEDAGTQSDQQSPQLEDSPRSARREVSDEENAPAASDASEAATPDKPAESAALPRQKDVRMSRFAAARNVHYANRATRQFERAKRSHNRGDARRARALATAAKIR